MCEVRCAHTRSGSVEKSVSRGLKEGGSKIACRKGAGRSIYIMFYCDRSKNHIGDLGEADSIRAGEMGREGEKEYGARQEGVRGCFLNRDCAHARTSPQQDCVLSGLPPPHPAHTAPRAPRASCAPRVRPSPKQGCVLSGAHTPHPAHTAPRAPRALLAPRACAPPLSRHVHCLVCPSRAPRTLHLVHSVIPALAPISRLVYCLARTRQPREPRAYRPSAPARQKYVD